MVPIRCNCLPKAERVPRKSDLKRLSTRVVPVAEMSLIRQLTQHLAKREFVVEQAAMMIRMHREVPMNVGCRSTCETAVMSNRWTPMMATRCSVRAPKIGMQSVGSQAPIQTPLALDFSWMKILV